MKLILIGILFFTSVIYSESIKLKNGDIISGKLWRITPGFVLVESPYGIFKIPQKYVTAIEFGAQPARAFVKLQNGKEVYGKLLQFGMDAIHLEQDNKKLKLPWEEIREINFIQD